MRYVASMPVLIVASFARLPPRSLAAVLTFWASGKLTVALLRELAWVQRPTSLPPTSPG